ncbi:UDP-N-acetylglucosamine 1-carboxyvinyltransferase [Cutibacterium acnes JCM 18909]|nr:UDP-N-acetylglucosamine 1-carboxyvinyltransferase [Cutibacterium acnes JCM 18909]
MDNITPASVGRLIRDARKQHGMTQNQLAEILKTSQSAIHRWNQARRTSLWSTSTASRRR